MGQEYTVIKRNIQGEETWRYQGRLVEQTDGKIILEAFFDRQDMLVHGMLFARGDLFVETYYTDRWYNVFEIHNKEDETLRGWYCNIACPVKVEGTTLSYIDLALDLLVFPDGRQEVLDMDEFEALDLPTEMRQQALRALTELRGYFSRTNSI